VFVPQNKQILIVQGDDIQLSLLQEALGRLGYPVTPCRSAHEATALATGRDFDLAALGMDIADLNPIDLARRLKRQRSGMPVLLTATPEAITAAQAALGRGVDDYLLLPPDLNEIRLRVGRILEARDLGTTMALLRNEIVKRTNMREFVAQSETMRAVLDKIEKISPMRTTVLILGESGAGKELVARAIHYASPRRDGPFVALNCSAIPENLIESELFGHERGAFTGAVARTQGKFELSHNGTLFLDEIGEMNPSAQVKLLRVLEEREFMRVGGAQWVRVDVRVLAATNANLERLVENGRFRADLYFRLKVVTVQVPPLRDRREDIPILARTFTDQISRANNLPSRRITEEAIGLFQTYAWPGNVREMKNLLESLLVSTSGEMLDAPDLPPPFRAAGPVAPLDPRPFMSLEEMERELIRRTLDQTRGNRIRTARMLRIGVRTLQRKIARYGLK